MFFERKSKYCLASSEVSFIIGMADYILFYFGVYCRNEIIMDITLKAAV